jgi:hypothetical protein
VDQGLDTVLQQVEQMKATPGKALGLLADHRQSIDAQRAAGFEVVGQAPKDSTPC